MILNFEGEAESVDVDQLVEEILESVPGSARNAARTSRPFRDLVLVLVLLLVLDGSRARAQDDFDPRSVALRTALHHDPSLEAPFADLVDL